MTSPDIAPASVGGTGPVSPTFPVLDTMRAIGAFGVLLTHVAFWSGNYTNNGYFGVLLARADVGVALFFVLSGFLLSRPWIAAARTRTNAPTVGRYFWKRALRILPVYFVTVALALGLIHANAGLGIRDWLRTLLMLDIYTRPNLPAGLTQMWSLATEAAFYVVLPAAMWILLGRSRARRQLKPGVVVLGVVVTFAITIGWHLWWAADVPGTTGRVPLQWLPAMLNWFGLGIGIALVYELHQGSTRPRRTRQAIVSLGQQPGACWALAGGLWLLSATPIAGPTMLTAPTTAESLTKVLIYGVIAALVILPGVFADANGGYVRTLSLPLFRRLGHTSYGLFCLHLPILHFVMWSTGFELFRGNFWPILALTLALSLAAAEVSYRAIEEPSIRLRNVGRRSSAAATIPPSTSRQR